MKSVKQIRELQVQLSENIESSGDVRKLTTLVRAGLFDPNKLTMLKRALNKENVKMSRAERDTLLDLLDRLLNVIMANQGAFMKVKQSLDEEISPDQDGEFSMARSDLKTAISSAQKILDKLNGEGKLEAWLQSKITLASDYLSSASNYVDSGEAELKEDYEEYEIKTLDEASRVDLDINQIPSIIIMKRRAIRVFPDGQKVALYWADRINKYISVPFQSIGISEDYDPKDIKKDKKDEKDKKNEIGPYLRRKMREKETTTASTLRKMKDPVKSGLKNTSGLSTAGKIGHNIGYAIGASIRKRVLQNRLAKKMRAGANKAADQKKMSVTGQSESFKYKLDMIREHQEVNEALPLAVGAAARLAPMAIRGAAALSRSKVGRAAARGTGKVLRKAKDLGKKVARGAMKSAKGAVSVAGAAASSSGKAVSSPYVTRPDSPAFKGSGVRSSNSYQTTRQRQADVNMSRQNENYKIIKNIAEGTESKEIKFYDGEVELTPYMATKIVETYIALNNDNKKIVQEMINKDKNSFMKFVNFASSK